MFYFGLFLIAILVFLLYVSEVMIDEEKDK